MFTLRPGTPDLAEILPGLLVGAYPAPADVPWLVATHAIDAVLSLQDDFDLAAKRLVLGDLEEAYRRAAVAFARLPVPDGDEARMAAVLPAAVARVAAWRAAGRVVYVHCNAGMNRAPTVAVAYVHLHQQRTLAGALGLVKARRPCLPFHGVLTRLYGAGALPPSRR